MSETSMNNWQGSLLSRHSGRFALTRPALDPQNASAHHNLALAYARSGKDAQAQPEFDAACRLNPSFCATQDQR